MPKKIDPDLRARAVRLVTDHLGEYPSLTAASFAVAKQLGVSRESVRRWVMQAQVDDGQRSGSTTEELAEIKTLKVKVRRLATWRLIRIWLLRFGLTAQTDRSRSPTVVEVSSVATTRSMPHQNSPSSTWTTCGTRRGTPEVTMP